MKSVRKSIVLMLAVMMLFGLSACGEETTEAGREIKAAACTGRGG